MSEERHIDAPHLRQISVHSWPSGFYAFQLGFLLGAGALCGASLVVTITLAVVRLLGAVA